jgi:hypothetical protein
MHKLVDLKATFEITATNDAARDLALVFSSVPVGAVQLLGASYEHDIEAHVHAAELVNRVAAIIGTPCPVLEPNTLFLPGHLDEFYDRAEITSTTMTWRDTGDAQTVFTIAKLQQEVGSTGMLEAVVHFIPDTLPGPQDIVAFKQRVLN